MISIIIVNYNPIYELRECLKAIAQSHTKLPLETIIVNNVATCSLQCLLSEFWQNLSVKLIQNQKNLGYARAVNLGIKNAGGRYLLIINPDVRITPGTIDKMVAFLDSREDIGILAPQLLNPDGTIQNSCFRFPHLWTPIIRRTFLQNFSTGRKELARYLMFDFDHENPKEVDWVLGAAMMTRDILLKRVGLMDERFFLYFEDVDWCRRFQDCGFKIVYFPQARFFHQYSRSSAKNRGFDFILNKFFWFHLISAIKYFKKWHKPSS
jgi:GT2 family glycosyltransferase